MKNFEEYWEQTREKWAKRAEDPCGRPELPCGLCLFDKELVSLVTTAGDCEFCPVVKVYGVDCEEVKPVQDYYDQSGRGVDVEMLSRLAEAIVQELDDKKDELIAAMRDLWEEAND